jgi:hypothetical protein
MEGITIQRFLQAGLIQRPYHHPRSGAIGSGIPLFGALQRDIALKHVATPGSYASGLVQSEYVIAPTRALAPDGESTRKAHKAAAGDVGTLTTSNHTCKKLRNDQTLGSRMGRNRS